MRTPHEIGTYLAAIIESSDDAIISKNLNGIITSWNASAERIFGYTSDEMVGNSIMMLIPQDRQSEEGIIIEQLKAGKRVNHFETIRRRKDGSMIELSITVSPIRNMQGDIIGASKVARDITERRQAEQALRELSMRKDEFLANMSHELRTPMNAVVGLANILSASSPLTDKQRKYIDTLKISADNLLALINDLLDFSKLESDAVELEDTEFDIREVLGNIFSIMGVKAREKGLSLEMHCAAGLRSALRGDPLRISQILTNLIGNAIKFTPSGSIDVTLESQPMPDDGALLTVTVKDTGIGIPAEKQESIFEKFSQADASITRKYGGSGLGLAICKALVDKMNGTIGVTSQSGSGSAFTFSIPLKVNSSLHAGHVSQSAYDSHEGEGNKAILLVEDYPSNVVVATALFDRFGYSYEVATSGREALERFRQNSYGVILMDVQMHDMDGIETTRLIRDYEKAKEMQPTPIIAMTAHVHEANRVACLDAGMNDFVPKPFDPDELFSKIRSLIQAY